jgi:tRNA modification GTPase
LTKGDLDVVLDLSKLPFKDEEYFRFNREKIDTEKLIEAIETAFISDSVALREGRILTNARQKADLIRAMELVGEAIFQIQTGEKDVASLTLESALSALLEIDGKEAGEKILHDVFSRFCIGK